MTIKADKKSMHVVLILMGCCTALAILFYIELKRIEGPLLFLIVSSVLSLRLWIAIGRTIYINENGLTITFGPYRKEYLWEELRTKKRFDCKNAYGYKDFLSRGAEFSPLPDKRPSWFKPASYCVFAHPLLYIYVYYNRELSRAELQYPLTYVVDEDDFTRNLETWQVVLSKTGDGLCE